MCRSTTCKEEKLLMEDEQIEWNDEEEEEEEEEEDQVIDEDIPEFDEEAHALWVFRKTFELLEDGLSVEAEPAENIVEDTTEWSWKTSFPYMSSFDVLRLRSIHQMANRDTNDRGYESA